MADRTASVSGNWSNTATWGGSAVPTDGQSVAINGGITVNFDVDQSAFATGINGITLASATSVLKFANRTPTTANGGVYLQLKTATGITGAGGVKIGEPVGVGNGIITRPVQITSLLVDGAPANQSGQAVIKCADTTGFVGGGAGVGSTIYLVNGAESGSPSTSLRETLTVATVDTQTQLTCTGNLTNSYTAAAGAYVTQLAIPGVTINFAGAYSASGAINTSIVAIVNGWNPTTGSPNSNAYCMLHADAAIGQGYVDLENDMGFNAGEQILISSPSTTLDSANNIYTVTKYDATGGVDSKPRVHIYPVLATTARAGGHTGAQNNDYAAWYSRPILVSRTNMGVGNAFISATTTTATVTGIQFYNSAGVYFNMGAIDGATVGNSTYQASYVQYSYGSGYVNNCTCYRSSGIAMLSATAPSSGCFFLASIGYNSTRAVALNPVATNTTATYYLIDSSLSTFINPIARYAPLIGGQNQGDNIIIGGATAGAGTDIAITTNMGCFTLYGTTLGQTMCTGYTTQYNPVWGMTVKVYDHAGVAGSNYLWCKGGIGTTNQATYVYGVDTYGTMKFTVDSIVVNTPIFWDTRFYMPGNNRPLSFTVPMFATTGEGITAAVWIVDPANDPLWFTAFPATTYLAGVSAGTAQGNALAVSNMPTPNSAWNTVNVTVPAQSAGRELICRVIFMGTTVSKIGYAYLLNMQKMLMMTKQRFA